MPSHQRQRSTQTKYQENENRNGHVKENTERQLSPRSKYLQGIETSQKELSAGEVRDVRILQGQLDLARSTIDTLKEELSVIIKRE